MTLFDNYLKKGQEHNGQRFRVTTRGFCIGVPEAEAEATTSSIRLDAIFEDFLDVFQQLNNEKFIVLGRKGTGKSAIGEHILSMANNEPTLFSTFIKKDEIDIEKIVQIGKEEGVAIERALLYKWIILTKFVSLFADNQSIACLNGMQHLSKFIKKNRGFININNYEVKEIIKQYGISVNVEYFKRYLSANGLTNTEYRYDKAEFYKLIPDLEKVVVNVLKSDNENKYILMFDDLDIGLKMYNKDSVDTLADLIRIVKYYNNDVFARNSIESKIIVFIRTDIKRHLDYTADMPKIFASYATELRWYEDFLRNNETKLLLRRFINKRIQINFKEHNLVINNLSDPWTSFIDEQSFYGEKTGFKHIIDHTFFRPRDLILFFKNIGTLDLDIPLSSRDVNSILMKKFSMEMVSDIKGELSLNYDRHTIDNILLALSRCSGNNNREPFLYEALASELRNSKVDGDIDNVIEDLFEYSLIGNYDSTGNVSFKFRESPGETVTIDKQSEFILHYVLQTYFKAL